MLAHESAEPGTLWKTTVALYKGLVPELEPAAAGSTIGACILPQRAQYGFMKSYTWNNIRDPYII